MNPSIPRAALLAACLPCSLAGAQILPEPLFFDRSFEVISVLDYDSDGVDEVIGKSVAGDTLVAATLGADGRLVSEGVIANEPSTVSNFQLADIDGDGRLDLVATRAVTSSLDRTVVYYDRGNETFEDPVGIGGSTLGLKVITTDFDLDGAVDLLLYPASDEIQNESQLASIFYLIPGLGAGSFGPRESPQGPGQTLQGAAPIALDQDGDLDFVGISNLTKALIIARNVNGLLQRELVTGSLTGYLDLAVGDVNADGYPDVVGFRRTGAGAPANVDLLLGNSAGGLDAPTTILMDAPNLVADVDVGDFNGDLDLDVAITTKGTVQTAHQVLVLTGNGQGTFNIGLPSGTGEGEAWKRLEVGDVNGDGRDDVLNHSLSQADASAPSRELQLLRVGQASGGFTDLGQAVDVTPGAFTSEGLTGDLDGDGVLDVIGHRASALAWLRGTAGSRSFEAPQSLGADGTPLLVADFDADGVDEILVELPNAGGLRMIDGLGGGQFALFSTPGLVLVPGDDRLMANDFDGDGDLDIVVDALTGPGPVLYWIPNLLGFNFGASVTVDFGPSLNPVGPFVVGDFNADGHTDVAFGRLQTIFEQFTVWAEGLGGGAFAPVQDIGPSTASDRVFDLNGDGFDDLVWWGGLIGWFPGGPSGLQPMSIESLVPVANQQFPLGVADVDGDGLQDLMVWSPATGEVLGYRGNSATQTSFDPSPALVAARVALPFGGTDNVPALVDFGADGDLDLVAGQEQIPAWFENVARGPVGDAFCGPANPNSTGASSRILGVGSGDVAANDLTLRAIDLPANAFGFFIVSQTSQPATPVVSSSGLLCLDGDIGRYVGPGQIGSSGVSGSFFLELDLTTIPQPLGFVAAQPGSTWHFQAWHRDSSPAGPTSNFTDGLRVTFE